MKLGEDALIARHRRRCSTGSLGLDLALGVGGMPRGRVVEIYGPESSGKTTLALQLIAEAQKRGGICAFIDAEHALDVSYARKLGVKHRGPAHLAARQRRAGARDRRHAGALAAPSTCSSSTRSRRSCRAPRSRATWATRRWASRRASCRRRCASSPAPSPSRSTIVIFINQIRMKIGVMFGNPETTTGGNALKFYASVRLDIRRIGAIKHGDEVDRQPHQGEGREEQGRAAVPRGRVRHPLRHRHLEGGRADRPRAPSTASSRRRAPGTPSTASASARAARTRRTSCASTRDVAGDDRGGGCGRSSASRPTSRGQRGRATGPVQRERGRPRPLARGGAERTEHVDLDSDPARRRRAAGIRHPSEGRLAARSSGCTGALDPAGRSAARSTASTWRALMRRAARRLPPRAAAASVSRSTLGYGHPRARPLPRQRLPPARRAAGRAAPDPAARAARSASSTCRRWSSASRSSTAGSILVTGTTGSGKSTTLASMIDHINRTASRHVITVEDPIEYTAQRRAARSSRSARSASTARSFAAGLTRRAPPGPRRHPGRRNARPRDHRDGHPRRRDRPPGHVHAPHPRRHARPSRASSRPSPSTSATQTRLILASILKGIISQRLVPRADGKGMVPAVEVMVSTGARARVHRACRSARASSATRSPAATPPTACRPSTSR